LRHKCNLTDNHINLTGRMSPNFNALFVDKKFLKNATFLSSYLYYDVIIRDAKATKVRHYFVRS